jgi:hypothetical protein
LQVVILQTFFDLHVYDLPPCLTEKLPFVGVHFVVTFGAALAGAGIFTVKAKPAKAVKTMVLFNIGSLLRCG